MITLPLLLWTLAAPAPAPAAAAVAAGAGGGAGADGGALDGTALDGGELDGGELDGGELTAGLPEEEGCTLSYQRCHVSSLIIRVVRGEPEEELQLANLLGDLRGRPVGPDVITEAERRLAQVKRYTSTSCRFGEAPQEGALTCGLFKGRTIRRVDIEGLPWRLLETDLRKRVFLRGGEPIAPKGAKGYERIQRQQERVVEYLERQGYYGARVTFDYPKDSETAEVDGKLLIEGGEFVSVRNVEVSDPGPLTKGELEAAFGFMCLAPDGFLDAFETLTPSCLTRDQLHATRDRVEAMLRRMGYPEARIRARPVMVDPASEAEEDEGCTWSKDTLRAYRRQGLDPPPRCADIDVAVIAGPHLDVELVVQESDRYTDLRVELPAVGDWLQPVVDFPLELFHGARRTIFEPLSRALQVASSDETEGARDSDLWASDFVEVFGFDEARSADEVEAEATRLALEIRLARRGHFNGRVTMDYRRVDEEREVKVVYTLIPGPVSAVTSIELVGVKSFDKDTVLEKAKLETVPRPVGGGDGVIAALSASGFVDRYALDADAERLMQFYEDRGFQEVNVTWEGFRQPGGNLEVRFLVDEGPRYVIAELTFEGGVIPRLIGPMLAATELCKTGVAFEQGRPPKWARDCVGSAFNPDTFEADERRMLNVAVANGYPYTTLAIETVGFDDKGAQLIVRMGSHRDEEKPNQVRVGQIFIDGNRSTDEDVILRELAIDRRWLRPITIADGLTRLRRTGLFSRVDVEYIGIEERKDEVHLRLKLEERPSFTWDGSASFSTNQFFSVRTDVIERNFLGRMLELSAFLDFGLFIGRRTQAEVSLRWPRFLGLPLGFKLTGPGVIYDDRPSQFVARTPVNDGVGDAVPTWSAPDIRRRNLKLFSTLTIDYKPWARHDFVVGHDYEFRFEWDNPAGAPIEPLSLEALRTLDGAVSVVLNREPLQVSTFSPWIHYRAIDNPFDPTQGGLVEASIKLGSPFLLNAEWLGLTQVRGAYYYTLWRVTVAAHTKAWAGWSYGPAPRRSTLLSQNLVALGGDRSVRGFPQDRIGVKDLPILANDNVDVTRNGHLGMFGVQGNLELRLLAIEDLAIGDLKLAVFTDVGFVTENDPKLLQLDPARTFADISDIDHPRLGLSVGAGIRYVLPVGPLSLDYACSVLDRPLSERCAWHLQLGYAF